MRFDWLVQQLKKSVYNSYYATYKYILILKLNQLITDNLNLISIISTDKAYS